MAVTLAKHHHFEVKARAETDNRTIVEIDRHRLVIDEPVIRGGSDQGPTPLEVLAGAFAGCTNVIANRLAKQMRVSFRIIKIDVDLVVDTDLLKVGHSVEVPFPRLFFALSAETNASQQELAELRKNLETTCPVSALFRAAGTEITSEWTITSERAE